MEYYKAFGLTIAADLPIREFLKIEAVAQPDVIMQKGSLNAVCQTNAQQLYLNLKQVGQFLIQRGQTIIYDPWLEVEQDYLRLFLLGSAMGALLQQRGLIVLHGNAVSFDGQECSIFVGHRGSGKSTMAAACLKRGATILADDVCAITFDATGNPLVIPSYPQIKIWQHSADLLNIDTTCLPRIVPKHEKYAMRIEAQFVTGPLRLKEVFEIDPACEMPCDLSGSAKINLLLMHSYRPHFLRRMQFEMSYLKKLMLLAGKIHIRKRGRENLESRCSRWKKIACSIRLKT